jgi:hypothetical protein
MIFEDRLLLWNVFGIVTALLYAFARRNASEEDASVTSEYKVFDGFDSFYPFYQSQHQDSTCQSLHFAGTSIILFMTMLDMKIVLSFLAAGLAGACMFPVSHLVQHGLFEMAAMLCTFLLCTKKLTGNWWKGFAILLVGYGFAWAGHFYYELNRPATFLYPTYSLVGDFRLWFDMATRSLDVAPGIPISSEM